MTPRVLVVDDDDQVRKALKILMESTGYAAVTAGNGREALRTVGEIAVDLVITDLFMPEAEGLETIGQLKKEHPKIKIIAISGGWRDVGAGTVLTMAGFLGADAVFAKPVDNGELLGAVGKLLQCGGLKRGSGRGVASKDDFKVTSSP